MPKYLYAVPKKWPKGPYSVDELKTFLADGTISTDTLVAEERSELWQTVSDLLAGRKPVANTERIGNAVGSNVPAGSSSDSSVSKLFGIVLVVSAVIAVIVAQPIYRKAAETYMFRSMAQGGQLRLTADLLHYGGIGIGAIGVVIFLSGLLSGSRTICETTNSAPSAVRPPSAALTELKQMLDKHLISESEYETKKQEILQRM